MEYGNDNTRRIERILETDSGGGIANTLALARSDIAAVLSEFMAPTALSMSVERIGNMYELDIKVKVSRFYEVGKTTMRRYE